MLLDEKKGRLMPRNIIFELERPEICFKVCYFKKHEKAKVYSYVFVQDLYLTSVRIFYDIVKTIKVINFLFYIRMWNQEPG